ncbi:ribosomal protein L7/L12 [Dactylosporangium sp. CA-139114]|uniref:ribosomal protein L7/L12 n=1 Tax=Dactylosporangium sp. CA-139114 TaxID=3239931 RepID=UPI003D997DDB
MDGMVWIVPVAFFVVLLLGLTLRRGGPDPSAARRLAAIERKLDLIMENLGIQEPVPDAHPMVLQELQQGRKIQAIKAYREATGVGLKEAKDDVEAIARRYGLI